MNDYLRENLREYIKEETYKWLRQKQKWFRENWKKAVKGVLVALAAVWLLSEIIPRNTYYDFTVSGVTWDWEQAAADGNVRIARGDYGAKWLQWDWEDIPDQPAAVRITGRYYHNIFLREDKFIGTLTFSGPDGTTVTKINTAASYNKNGSISFMEFIQGLDRLYVSFYPETGRVGLQMYQWLDSIPDQWYYPLFASTVDQQEVKDWYAPKAD